MTIQKETTAIAAARSLLKKQTYAWAGATLVMAAVAVTAKILFEPRLALSVGLVAMGFRPM